MIKIKGFRRRTASRFATLLALGLVALASAVSAQDQGGATPLSCLLVPVHSSNLGSERSGIVADVLVQRADYVQAGQLLVQLDDGLAASDLELAKITRDALAAKIARSEPLVTSNMIPRDEFVQMQTDFAIAAAQAKRAEMQVRRAKILAPFAGYISRTFVEKGELIGNEPLVQLIDTRLLNAELVFTSEAFGRFKIGDKMQIAVDLVNQTVTGKVMAVDPFLDASSNTFSVTIEIDNSTQMLPAGAACRLVL